jgi:signal transduction histidine kinase
MALVDKLQAYLTRLRDRPGSFTPPSSEELAQLRQYLRARFEKARRGSDPEQQQRLRQVFSEVVANFEDFVWDVCWRLDDLALDVGERLDVLQMAIDIVGPEFQDSDDSPTPVWQDALKALVRAARIASQVGYWWRTHTALLYAGQLRLIQRRNRSFDVSPMGETFLHLVGREATRWLLALEIAQSLGPDDPWRMDRGTASALSRLSSIPEFSPDGPPPWPMETLDRLVSLLLLSYDAEFPPAHYWMTDAGRVLLAEAGGQETPFTVLAQAMVADQTQAVLAALDHGSPNAAAEATVRHTRMVAHEIRNALVPVRIAAKQLWRDLGNAGQEVLAREPRQTIDGNIERIFRFLDESLRLSRLASAPPELFELLPAIQDAIRGLDQPPRGPIEPEIAPGASAVRVRGHRQRLVLALVNLLRNAVQAGGPDVSIGIQVATLPEQKRIRLVLEDNGPGIAPEQRTTIFQNGVSHRSGGTGHGLTLVREVIEREMSGKIACEDNPLGGARFVIELPWA